MRVILEHTIVLHWIIERGDEGVEAFQASQSKQIKRWLANTRNTSMVVPPTIERELTDSFVGIDEAKALQAFKNVCKEVDADDLYSVYGILSSFVHPSITTSNAYCSDLSGPMTAPAGRHTSNISLIAHCLIWAARSLLRLVPDPARDDGLEKLAQSIRTRPMLPGYHPLPVPARPSGRSSRRRSRRRN